jgi:hypothetical protein
VCTHDEARNEKERASHGERHWTAIKTIEKLESCIFEIRWDDGIITRGLKRQQCDGARRGEERWWWWWWWCGRCSTHRQTVRVLCTPRLRKGRQEAVRWVQAGEHELHCLPLILRDIRSGMQAGLPAFATAQLTLSCPPTPPPPFCVTAGVLLLCRVPEGALERGWPQAGVQGSAGCDW